MSAKKNVFLVSSVYVAYSIILILVGINCPSHADWCNIRDEDPLGVLFFVFMPLLPAFFLSLITYKMKDEVFWAWWGFASWFVPIMVFVMFLLNNTSQQSGFASVAAGAFNFLIISIFYIVFLLVSAIRIALAYKRTK